MNNVEDLIIEIKALDIWTKTFKRFFAHIISKINRENYTNNEYFCMGDRQLFCVSDKCVTQHDLFKTDERYNIVKKSNHPAIEI